jgi:hypothetical protein
MAQRAIRAPENIYVLEGKVDISFHLCGGPSLSPSVFCPKHTYEISPVLYASSNTASVVFNYGIYAFAQ